MDKKDIESVFGDYLFGDKGEEVIRINNHQILLDVFLGRFQDSKLTLSSLLKNKKSTDAWKETFEGWNVKGILPD